MPNDSHNGIMHSIWFHGRQYTKSVNHLGDHLKGRILKDLLEIFHIDPQNLRMILKDLQDGTLLRIENQPINAFLISKGVIQYHSETFTINRENLDDLTAQIEALSADTNEG